MELNAADILIIVNTMHGSLRVNDEGKIFMFAKPARDILLRKLIKQASLIGIEININKEVVNEPSQTPTNPDTPSSSAG